MSWWDGVTVRGQGPDGTAEEIRIGLSRPQGLQRLVFALPAVLLLLEVGGAGGVVAALTLVCLVLTVQLWLNARMVNVRLTQHELLVRGGFGRRRIPWSDIRGIRTRNYFCVSQIVIDLVDGKRRKLGAPITGFPYDPYFDRKLATIRVWWERGRGW